MITYKGVDYSSKTSVVRAMFLAGDMDNSPEQKKRVAVLLSMTVQTVHATLIKMNEKPTIMVPEAPVVSTPKMFVDSYADVKRFVEDRYNECYEIAKTKGYDLPKIRIDWSLKGTVAGMFCIKFNEKYFRVNLELAKQNMEDYLKQTIPHEFSHYIVRAKESKNIGRRSAPHGWEWKNIMVSVFGLDPKCSHSYDVSTVRQGNRNRFEYKCSCSNYVLGAVRHHRLQMNPTRYQCCNCHGYLTFVKKV
jgi:SprT protein